MTTLDTIVEVERYPEADQRVVALNLVRAGGGTAATAAVTLSRLGVSVAFVGVVGDDPAGEAIRSGLEVEGVDIVDLRTVAGARSGESVIVVAADGNTRAISAYLGTGGPPTLSPRALQRCMQAEWVHVDHASYAVVDALRAAGPGPRISLDHGNPIPDLRLDGIALFAPTTAMLSRRYPDLDVQHAMLAALAEGVEIIAVTQGAAGSSAASGGQVISVPAHQVAVRSTLGAGDVFHGALLAALLDDRPLREALEFANLVAGLACRSLDGRSSIPTLAELVTMGLQV